MNDAALERMPHRGAMRLIETIEQIGPERIQARARDHGATDYPLRIGGRLFTVALVELGAQAAAAHASIHGVAGAHTGLLLSIRDMRCMGLEVTASTPLIVEAERSGGGEDAAQYRFSVAAAGTTLVEGAAVMSMQGGAPE
ncbi:MAG: hypothetical protein AAGI13_03980 [Pseudomonadota bacterium]